MSVYKHEYQAYTGTITPLWSRIVVVVRYALAEAWSSRITVGLFCLSMLPVFIYLIGIYLGNNSLARTIVLKRDSEFQIGAGFFLNLLSTQCWIALALAAWIAPRLVSFDLADNALPILLSHPISRFGYVLGKFIALIACLSSVTWIPCLLLFVYQGYSSAQPWFAANMRIAGGLLAGSLLWIAFLSVLGLAVSAWVKWRVVATGAIFAVVFVPAGIGGIITGVLRTRWGFLLNVPVMMTQLWQRLLGGREIMEGRLHLPTAAILLVLSISCGICILMLNARIRGREVVRG